MKTAAWTLAGIACGAIAGGVVGFVLNVVIVDIDSAGQSNEMLGVAGIDGALFGVPLGGLLLGGLALWRSLRR